MEITEISELIFMVIRNAHLFDVAVQQGTEFTL